MAQFGGGSDVTVELERLFALDAAAFYAFAASKGCSTPTVGAAESSAPRSVPAKRSRADMESTTAAAVAPPPPSARGFDFARFRFRHVALHVLYLGARYHGFAAQLAKGSASARAAATAAATAAASSSTAASAAAPPPAPSSQHTVSTVESALFAALTRACLVEDCALAGYTRCGRTDAGVSAAGQLVALRLRSKARMHVPAAAAPADAASAPAAAAAAAAAGGAPWRRHDGLDNAAGEAFPAPAQETDYAAVLNAILPDDIRVAGWADVEDEDGAAASAAAPRAEAAPLLAAPRAFSARFSCTRRTYRYFFVDRSYDVGAMRDAAARMCGRHDFRNFAKFDVVNQQYFVRRVESVRIVAVGSPDDAAGALPLRLAAPPLGAPPLGAAAPPSSAAPAPTLFFLEVAGQAFLWHQVRCMAAVLFLVGARLEAPSVVDFLLDTRGRCRSRPQYALAAEQPLCLHHCAFGEEGGGSAGGDSDDELEDDEEGGDAAAAAARARLNAPRGRPHLYAQLACSAAALASACAPLHRRWEALQIEAAMLGSMLQRLNAVAARAGLPPWQPPCAEAEEMANARGRAANKPYVPLAARPREPTLADKWARLGDDVQRRVAVMHPLNTRRMLAEIGGGGGDAAAAAAAQPAAAAAAAAAAAR